jgi:uncharacterized protein YlzI (FlbEa/FlbD family)
MIRLSGSKIEEVTVSNEGVVIRLKDGGKIVVRPSINTVIKVDVVEEDGEVKDVKVSELDEKHMNCA